MRVIEPKHNQRVTFAKKRSQKVLLGSTIVIIVLLIGFIGWKKYQARHQLLGSSDQHNTSSARTQSGMKYMSAYDFQKVYEKTAYPNTQQLTDAPHITGSAEADARIRQIAESRGYKKQAIPVSPIVKVDEIPTTNSNLLQPLAYKSWLQLREKAENENIPLSIQEGYLSIETQRERFMAKLQEKGITKTSQVTNGEVDDKLIEVMQAVAPPGYTRHHTGYAIDLACTGVRSSAFETSKCATWLKNDNYAVLKQAGFIPSQVDGVGPPATSTEYKEVVFVGTDSFY